MRVLINTVIWSTDAPYSPDGIDWLSWPRRFVHMFGYRMHWARFACKVCALVKWTEKKREQRHNVHCVINNQREKRMKHRRLVLLYLSLMCGWNGAWMCDRCHIFTPDHFSTLAHTTALIRRALYVLHVSCRLEKEKKKICKYRWTLKIEIS